jgi:hypothetical protein
MTGGAENISPQRTRRESQISNFPACPLVVKLIFEIDLLTAFVSTCPASPARLQSEVLRHKIFLSVGSAEYFQAHGN